MATKTANSNMFFGGIPTAPEVRRIDEIWPMESMQIGDRIEYADMAELLGCRRNTARYKTVTSAWRRRVESETGKIIGTIKGEAFVVLTDSEKVDLSGAKLKTAVRHTRRAFVVAGMADRKQLNSEQCARVDHLQNIAARVQETARLAAKNDLPSLTG